MFARFSQPHRKTALAALLCCSPAAISSDALAAYSYVQGGVSILNSFGGFAGGEGFSVQDPIAVQRVVHLSGVTHHGAPYDAVARAQADLGAGKMAIYGEASGAAYSEMGSALQDNIIFSGPFNGGDRYLIPITLTVSGTMTVGAGEAYLFAHGSISSAIGGVTLGNGTQVISGILETRSNMNLQMGLRTVPHGGVKDGILNFGNSALFSWELPPGVTYTSESGVFLTTVPVPEPATLLLLVISAAALALLRRSRSIGRLG